MFVGTGDGGTTKVFHKWGASDEPCRVSFVDQRDISLGIGELHRNWTAYGHDLVHHDPGGAAECLVRGGELIVRAEHADTIVERFRRWIDHVHHDEGLLLARIRLRAAERSRCVEIARDAGAQVNHVHLGSSVMYGTPVMYGTGAQPESSPPVPEPPESRWDPPVTIGVLDTGCDPHPWFRDRDWFVPVPEILDADDDSGQDRQAGHGTFVNGVLLQHAPGVVIRTRRALSSLGFTDDLTIATELRALRRSAALSGETIDVLVLTSGCLTPDDRCPPALAAELQLWVDTVVVAAAGNHGSDRPFWPAALPDVLGVAATGPDGRAAAFSGAGDWVDVAAPGVGVRSSYVQLEAGGARRFGYARWSGTSFAAPRVAAAVATSLQAEGDPNKARDFVRHCYPFGR